MGAPVRRVPARPRDARHRLPRRPGAGGRGLRRRRGRCREPRTRAGGCTRGRGSSTTSTCSPGRRATSRLGARARLPAATRRTTTTPTPGPTYERALEAAPRPTVPCNNDLLAANFIDDGRAVWLIDYEYSGNNDACFELGNTSTECNFTPGADRGLDRGLLRRPDPRRPGAGPAAGAVQPVRLVALGLHPGRHQPDRLRLPRVGDGALREGRGDVPRPRASPGSSRMSPVVDALPRAPRSSLSAAA